MAPRRSQLNILLPLAPTEVMTASYFKLEKGESRQEKPLLFRKAGPIEPEMMSLTLPL
jgi:hypothetical protein